MVASASSVRLSTSAGETVSRADDPAELDAILAAAGEAGMAWAKSDPSRRRLALRAVAAELRAHRDELVELAAQETSINLERLRGEVERTAGQLELFGEIAQSGGYLEVCIEPADPFATPPRPDLRRMLRPIGTVAIFAAGNFPFAFSVAGGDTAAALAAGCAVVVKAHPGHPRLSRRTAGVVATALSGAGAPQHLLSLAEGLDTGVALVEHPAVSAVAFTGSTPGGRALFDLANRRPVPIPFYGELGSVNPVVITPAAADQRTEGIAAGFVASYTLGVGQLCTKPGVVFLPRGHDLIGRIVDAAAQAPGGPMLGSGIGGRFTDRLGDLDGDRRLTRLLESRSGPGDRHTPALYLAHEITDELLDDLLTHECFGPAAVLVGYDDLGQVTRQVGRMAGQLTGTVHIGDATAFGDAPEPGLVELLDAMTARVGRVVLNGWPTGVTVGYAMHHGGPYPASTNALFTSVGSTAIRRFLVPISYQDTPQALLPHPLRDHNPWNVFRQIREPRPAPPRPL